MSVEIPTIDLKAPDAADALMDAYTRVGFAQIVGHGVAADLVSSISAANRSFHRLPIEEKRRLELDDAHRGYIEMATSTDRASELGAAASPNQSESFMLMGESERDTDVYLSGPNQWPDLPGFRDAVEAYAGAMDVLARRVLAVFAAGLDADASFDVAFTEPTTWLRLLHYPEQNASQALGAFGSAPHVDFGAITLLAQDEVGGLQVQTPQGDWNDVPPLEGAFVMNTGEMLRRWSANQILATPHRVANPQGLDRYSVAYFFDPHMTAVIEPVAGPAASGTKIEAVRFDRYVRTQLEATYDHHRGR